MPNGTLTEAEHKQRVDAAKARWANHTRRPDAPPAADAPKAKPWSGEALGVGRGVKVQSSALLAPVWRQNYDGAEWGYPSTGPEQEGGGRVYETLRRKPQAPKGMPAEEFVTLGRWANGIANDLRESIVAEGLNGDRKKKVYRTIPASKRNDPETIKLAFNHARMLALHDVGLIGVSHFRLTPEAKEKLRGMQRFMWRARRQISNPVREGRAETWATIRREHGKAFNDGRTRAAASRGTQAGEEKRHFPYHATMVKRWNDAMRF